MVCGPIELIMIQQQAKGGGLFSTAVSLMQAGPSTFFRGTLAMMAREGIYAGSFLGMMPVMREQFMQMYPDSIGKTEDSARFSAAFLCAPIGGILSHPPDTIKTCMQGNPHPHSNRNPHPHPRPHPGSSRTARVRGPSGCRRSTSTVRLHRVRARDRDRDTTVGIGLGLGCRRSTSIVRLYYF